MTDFINLDPSTGRKKQFVAADSSTGSADAGRVIKTNGAGVIDQTLLPSGVGAQAKVVTASETLSAGDFVNIFDDGGTPGVRRASASAPGLEAHGFVLDNFAASAGATVFFEGANTALSGLTPGATLFLSADTPGAATTTAPTGSGNVVQIVGKACATDSAIFIEDDGVCRA